MQLAGLAGAILADPRLASTSLLPPVLTFALQEEKSQQFWRCPYLCCHGALLSCCLAVMLPNAGDHKDASSREKTRFSAREELLLHVDNHRVV